MLIYEGTKDNFLSSVRAGYNRCGNRNNIYERMTSSYSEE